MQDLVCNASMLSQFLTVDEGQDVFSDLQAQLCNLSADVLLHAERLFLSQLDYTKFFTVSKGNEPYVLFFFYVLAIVLCDCPSNCPSPQRDRLIRNAADLRDISQAVTLASKELAVLIDDV